MKRIFTDIQDFEDGEDSDSGEEKEKTKKYQHKTGATLFLIDARENMFLPSSDNEIIPFLKCLECVRGAIRNKIFSSEKCFCSIILLGTKGTDNPLSLSNIRVVQELKLLGAEHVLKVDEIIEAVEKSTYKKEYDFGKFSLGDAFWLSAHILNQRPKETNKSIIYFTNDDSPVLNDRSDLSRAVVLAQDMYRNYIVFDFIPIGQNFDTNKFYKKIVQASKNDANYVIPDPATKICEMLKRVTMKNIRHVNLVKLPFVIHDDMKIGVSVHYLVKKAKLPFKVKLSKSTNERVITKMQVFEAESGSLVSDNNIIKSQFIGDKDINFRTSELRMISEYGKQEIRLLGFKPASTVRLENFVKPCAFIYPDDSTYKGSSTFFTALLKRCIAKQVVPICTFCLRKTSSCKFVALIAQDESLNSDKIQDLPPGFVVFFLPFAEEVRTVLEDKETKRAKQEEVEVATKLVKKLKFTYRVGCFQNPRLRTHWAAIEALALDLSEPEEVNDSTYPNYSIISKRTGPIAKEFIETIYSDRRNCERYAAPRRTAKPKFDLPIDKIEEMIKEGHGERLTNDALKIYLTKIGLGKGVSKMKKTDMLNKIREHLKLKEPSSK